MANQASRWKEALFLLLLCALVSRCQQYPESPQIVPLSTYPIFLDNRKTQGLPEAQRFRQILRINENHQRIQEVNRFPQSFPDPPASQQNLPRRSETTGIPHISRVESLGINTRLQRLSDNLQQLPPTVVKLETQRLTPNTTLHISRVLTPQTNANSPFNQNVRNFQQIPNQTLDQRTPRHQRVTNTQFASDPQILQQPEGPRSPEAPRVPQIPAHLPVDLTNRLQEFPSLVASIEQAQSPASMHSFFEPTHEVQSEELTDEEWQQYLVSEWGNHGLVPTYLAFPPNYVVNVNYGDHLCLHLGNVVTPAQARHRPKSFEFPGEGNRQYAVMLVDIDRPTGTYINWLLINVPLDQLHKGTEIVEYEPPRPGLETGLHRMLFLVYLQKTAIPPTMPSLPNARACQTFNREGVDLSQLTRDLGLKGPLAGNYFRTSWDVTVEHVCSSN